MFAFISESVLKAHKATEHDVNQAVKNYVKNAAKRKGGKGENKGCKVKTKRQDKTGNLL